MREAGSYEIISAFRLCLFFEHKYDIVNMVFLLCGGCAGSHTDSEFSSILCTLDFLLVRTHVFCVTSSKLQTSLLLSQFVPFASSICRKITYLAVEKILNNYNLYI